MVIKMSTALAQHWLREFHYDGQRQFRPSRVDYLAEEMSRGTFLKNSPVHLAKCNNKEYLINGQHTLRAIIKSGCMQELSVIDVACSSMEEVAIAYGVIDTQLKRSVSDMFSALNMAEEIGLTNTLLSKLGTGVKILKTEFAPKNLKNIHPNDLKGWIREYAESGKRFFSIIAGAPQEMTTGLQRGTTVAVALATIRYASHFFGEARIESFWRGVAFDDRLSITDARKVAHIHLLTTGFSGGGLSRTKRSIVSESYSARYLAHCFNAFVENREITKTLVRDSSAPIVIDGTPFTGCEYGSAFGSIKI